MSYGYYDPYGSRKNSGFKELIIGGILLLGLGGWYLWDKAKTAEADLALNKSFDGAVLINKESLATLRHPISLSEIENAKLINLSEGTCYGNRAYCRPPVTTCELVFQNGKIPTLFFHKLKDTSCEGTRPAMATATLNAQAQYGVGK